MFYPFKKALIGLDLSAIDDDVVKYTFFITQILPTLEELIFVHITPPLAVETAEISAEKSLEIIGEYIKQKTTPHTAHYPKVKTEVKVIQGDPITQLLDISRHEQIDVILVGRKSTLEGSNNIPKKLALKALCSVWCVPEKVKLQAQRVFMPIDFSDFSKMAMDYALALSQSMTIDIVLLHIYKPSSGRHVLGKSAEQMADVMEESARLNYQEFIQQYEHLKIPTVTPLFAHDETRRLSDKICYAMAQDEEADFIMLGSRGRTEAAATLMGSFAEQLLTENSTLPMLILKGKRKNLNMMQAIFKL